MIRGQLGLWAVRAAAWLADFSRTFQTMKPILPFLALATLQMMKEQKR